MDVDAALRKRTRPTDNLDMSCQECQDKDDEIERLRGEILERERRLAIAYNKMTAQRRNHHASQTQHVRAIEKLKEEKARLWIQGQGS